MLCRVCSLSKPKRTLLCLKTVKLITRLSLSAAPLSLLPSGTDAADAKYTLSDALAGYTDNWNVPQVTLAAAMTTREKARWAIGSLWLSTTLTRHFTRARLPVVVTVLTTNLKHRSLHTDSNRCWSRFMRLLSRLQSGGVSSGRISFPIRFRLSNTRHRNGRSRRREFRTERHRIHPGVVP